MSYAAGIVRLRSAVVAGELSREAMLEEIERQLDRSPDRPIDGALELVLEHLYETPSEPHLLRVLARLHERNGDLEGARRVLDGARTVRAATTDDAPCDQEVTPAEMSLQDRLAIGRTLIELGLLVPAREMAQLAVRAEPNSLSALNLLAKIDHIEGRLSELIDVWRRIRLLDPQPERALVQLAFIEQLSRDETTAGRPLHRVAGGMYNPKHEAQRELELVFVKFRHQDIQGALSACDQIAARFRDKAPRIYKLAAILKAWVYEHTGDLNAARSVLEQMGTERGFETDIDRLEFLGEICERLGTADGVQKAIHIYEHLNVRYGTLASLPRLVALSWAAGDAARAARYEHEYEHRLAVRMQKPSAVQVLRAFALYYLPLRRVPALRLERQDLATCELEIRVARDRAGRIRRRALLQLLRGDAQRAESIFVRLTRTRGAGHRDFAYLADLLARRGDAEAGRWYAKALSEGGGRSAELWRTALAWVERGGSAQDLSNVPREHAAWALEELSRRARQAPQDPERWEELATLADLCGDATTRQRAADKASALRAAPVQSLAVGRVAMAAAYFVGGRPKGVIHGLLAGRRRAPDPPAGGIDERDRLGRLSPDFMALIPRILDVVKDYARINWPHLCHDADAYTYTVRVTKDDELSSGSSAGLPLAVAFLSVLLDRPVPQDVALSGELVCDSARRLAVRPVGDALYKILGAYHGNLRTLFLPTKTVDEIIRTHAVPRSVSERLVKPVSDLDEVVTALWGVEAWDW